MATSRFLEIQPILIADREASHFANGVGRGHRKVIKKDPEIVDVPVILVSARKSLVRKDTVVVNKEAWTEAFSGTVQRDSLKKTLKLPHQNRGKNFHLLAPAIRSSQGSGPMPQTQAETISGKGTPQNPTAEFSHETQTETIPQPPEKEKPLVLLAEDNEMNARTVRDYLKAKGFRVEHVDNGLDAVLRTRELAPRVILMDIQMPVMDGLEAIREIRSDPAIQKVPILAITALAMLGDREKCLDAGADGYMAKPLSLKKLKEMVDQAIA